MNISDLISRLREEGVSVSVSDGQLNIEASSKPSSELIQLLRDNKEELVQALSDSVKIEKSNVLLFSPEQKSIWLAQNNQPESRQYNFPVIFDIDGVIDENALDTALKNIVRRHSVLRMVATHDGDDFAPYLTEIPNSILDVLSFDKESDADKAAQDFISQHFDLTKDLLLKCSLIKSSSSTKLCLLTHHIASDGWSVEIFINEMCNFYAEALENGDAVHKEADISYSDITYYNSLADTSESERYWRDYLKGSLLSNNIFRAKRDSDIYAGNYTYSLTNKEMDAIRKISYATGASVFTVLQSLYAFAISMYSGNSSVLLGSPVSGRELPDSQDLIGCFTKVMPFNIHFDSNTSFRSVIQKNQQALSEGSKVGLLPLQELMHLASGGTELVPNLETSFTLHNAKDWDINLKGVNAKKISEDFTFSRFDIELHALEGEQFSLTWVYNNAVIRKETPESLSILLSQIINKAVSELDTPLRDIRWSKQNSLKAFNTTKITVPKKFSEVATRYQDQIALATTDSRWTYKELDEKSNQIANYIHENIDSINLSGFIGICLPRSDWSIAAMLGILKAGYAFVPINPDYSDSKINECLKIADINFIITTSTNYQDIDVLIDKEVLLVDEDYRDAMLVGVSSDAPTPTINPNDPAYVMFTSGTTGKPKGVVVSHSAIIRLVEERAAFNFDTNTCMLHGSSQNFDASTIEIWGPLLNGGRVAVYEQHLSDISSLNHFMLTQEVTSMWMTSGLFDSWVGLTNNSLALNQIIVGGDTVSPASVEQCYQLYPQSKIINGYGPTENTTFTCCFPIPKDNIGKSIPIGKPINGTDCLVLDVSENSVLPDCALGELIATGDGLAIEYLNEPEKTKESFVDIEAFGGSIVRGYRTGDIVRRLPSGDFEYIGREDGQVKVRGFRIELEEISYTFNKMHGVKISAAVYDKDKGELRVFLLMSDESEKDLKSIRHYSSNNLPPHAQPHSFTFVNKIPLNANGKVDQSALLLLPPELENEEVSLPQNEIEELLLRVWKESLSSEKIGVLDNFFNVGGDSIKAIKVVSMCEQNGINISIKDIFENNTIRSLALAVKENGCNQNHIASKNDYIEFSLLNDEERKIAQSVSNLQDAYPLSELQKGMAYHHSIRPEMYHDIVTFRINEKFEKNTFDEVVSELVSHHEILRTLMRVEVGRGVQYVLKTTDYSNNVFDLTSLNGFEQERAIEEWKANILSSPIDLSNTPWGITIFLINQKQFVYAINFHHALFDGWSIATLNSTLFKRYISKLHNLKNTALPKHEPYSTYIRQELNAIAKGLDKNYLESISQDSNLPWWKDEIDHKTSSISLSFSEDRMAQIKSLSSKYGIQDKALLFAVYSVLLAKMTGQHQTLTSIVVNARPEVNNSDKTLGLFLNSLPALTPDIRVTWHEYLDSINELFIEQQSMKEFPMSEIQSQTGLKYDSSLFNYVDFHVYNDVTDLVDVDSFEIYEKTNYGLQFIFARNPQNNSLLLNMLSDCGMFDEQYLHYLMDEFFVILDKVDNGDSAVLNESLSPSADGGVLPLTLPYLQLFKKSVESNPNAICIKDDEVTLSYNACDGLSNRLAGLLLDAGISEGDVVGVSLPMTSSLLVSIIAIWKVGAVYLPIDPETPVQRKEYILKDSGAVCCLVPEVTGDMCVDEIDIADNLTVDECLIEYEDFTVESGANAENAYIIYTSGTTGNPKGVLVSHASLSGYLNHASSEYFTKASQGVVSTSINFDATITSLIGPSVAGKTVMLGKDTNALVTKCMDSNTSKVFKLTPSQLEIFLEGKRGSKVNTPHIFVIGGESLSVSLVRLLLDIFPNSECINEYGPTEATVGSVTKSITRDNLNLIHSFSVPIGNPIEGVGLYIVGKDLLPVMKGCKGELLIAGDMLANGYINNPEQTNRVFLDEKNGVSPKQLPRVYKTGDLVSLNNDNELVYHGREDRQIKHNGVRIELSEIENTIKALCGIKSVVVFYDKDSKQLICALVDNNVFIDTIISRLREAIPAYMMPNVWGNIDSIPLTINGKTDFDAIRKIVLSNFTSSAIDEEELTDSQKVLASLVSEVTGHQAVSLDSNFMEIGGDSLKIMLLLSKIKSHFDINLILSDIVKQKTVRGLSELVDQEVALSNVENIDDEGEIIF